MDERISRMDEKISKRELQNTRTPLVHSARLSFRPSFYVPGYHRRKMGHCLHVFGHCGIIRMGRLVLGPTAL